MMKKMTKEALKTKVFFHELKKPEQKLLTLFQISSRYSQTARSLQILAGSKKIAEYVDRSLWQNPSYSFIPHQIGISPLSYIHILVEEDPSIKYILNLTPATLSLPYGVIHEFEEGSETSKQKYTLYKEKGYNIILI